MPGSVLARSPRRVLVALLPAVAVVAGVAALMRTGEATLGFDVIFGSFAVGVAVTLLGPVVRLADVASASTGTTLRSIGLSLAGATTLTYLVFGCVFGCPA